MPLKPLENMQFGGVDSRSNPINLAQTRTLRCRNWVPKVGGWLQLRDGYSAITMTPFTGGLIHSMQPYTLNGVRYLIYWQGLTPRVLNIASGAVTTPTVLDTPIQSSVRYSYALSAEGHLLAFNRTDKKWFDGVVWRDVGLPAPSGSQIDSIIVTQGVRELTASEASTVTLTPSSSGTFPADTVGRKFYVVLFDTSFEFSELGPATIFVGSGSVKFTANQKITLGSLPDVSSSPGWVKLFAVTDDGQNLAYLLTDTNTAVSSISGDGSFLTITSTGHGLSVGDVCLIAGNAGAGYNGYKTVTSVVDANNFKVKSSINLGAKTGGTVKGFVTATGAASSQVITDPTVDRSYVANQERGIPASTVGGSQPGYLFYGAFYSRTGGGAVGNRVQLGTRQVNATRCNFRLQTVFSDLASNPEWELLFGRTDDSGSVPYAVQDNSGNWITNITAPGTGETDVVVVISQAQIDGNSELPAFNDVPPPFQAVWREGDRMVGSIANSPTVYRSASESDQRTGTFVGDPAQAWPITNIETLPTAESITGGFSFDLDSFVGSENSMGVLSELSGDLQWRGGATWNNGIIGRFAVDIGWQGLPYWISGDKELVTMSASGPTVISREYEGALLKKIGNANRSLTEVVYYQNPARDMFILRIKCQDSSGKPFVVIHDFGLRDERSPFGQGYEEVFLGPLANDFTTTYVRDANGVGQVWAGASDGHIYQLHTGGNDSDNEFTADYLGLLYAGPSRPTVTDLEWWGDEKAKWYLCKNFTATDDYTDGQNWTDLNDTEPEAVVDDDGNFHYKVVMRADPVFTHAYLWLTMDSHSDDGDTTTLSDPPHLPLETYGRIYGLTFHVESTNPR